MKPEYPKLTQVHKNLGKCAILPSLFLFTLITHCRGTQLGQNTPVLTFEIQNLVFQGYLAFYCQIFLQKWYFFYAFWRAAVKNQNKTIQLDFHQVGSYLVECGNVGISKHYRRFIIMEEKYLSWYVKIFVEYGRKCIEVTKLLCQQKFI